MAQDAGVDVQRSGLAQHEREIKVAAEHVDPGELIQPARAAARSRTARAPGFAANWRSACRACCDALGQAGRAGGEQEFCRRVRTDGGCGLLANVPGRLFCNFSKKGDTLEAGTVAARHELALGEIERRQSF
jgi:hypothetical protein